MTTLASDFGSIFTRWRTWFLMGNQDILMKYRRSLIGPFWISIATAAMILGIGYLFAEIQQQPFAEFLTYFGCGMIAWQLLSTMVNEGCAAVTESDAMLRGVVVPVPVLAARVVYRNLVVLGHNVLVIGLLFLVIGRPFGPMAALALPGLLLYLALGLALATGMAPLCARFRDVPQVVANIVQITFFLTPVFWMPTAAMGRPLLIEANPAYHLVQIVRAPLLGDELLAMHWWVSLGVLASAWAFAAASLAFSRKRVFLWL